MCVNWIRQQAALVREAAKKVLLLMAGPLRPYPPPLLLGLNGHRNFTRLFFMESKVLLTTSLSFIILICMLRALL